MMEVTEGSPKTEAAMIGDVVADVRQNDTLRIGILAPPWVGVPPETYGGTELMLDSLARALVRLGHDVRLFTTADSRCPVTTAHLFEHSDPDRMGASVLELRHVAAGYDDLVAAGVDIVHDHTLCGLFYNGRPADLPVVTTTGGGFFSLGGGGPPFRWSPPATDHSTTTSPTSIGEPPRPYP
jgi:hypothetical protein